MSESVLNALTHLFAIVANVGNEGISSKAKHIVESYLKLYLNKQLVNDYLQLFNNLCHF